MRFLVWIVVNVLALGAAALLFDGITVTGRPSYSTARVSICAL